MANPIKATAALRISGCTDGADNTTTAPVKATIDALIDFIDYYSRSLGTY
jgi:hypothetical protein